MNAARPLLLLLCLAVAPAPAAAQAETDQLRIARYHFDYGEYLKAIELVEDLQERKLLAEGPELVEAWRIVALSHFYLGDREEARTAFVQLLMCDPDFALDPVLVPPGAVIEFEAIRQEYEPQLAPIRELRRAMAEQRRLEEAARRRLLIEERRRRERDNNPLIVQRVEKHAFLTNFLPFGAAQLEQNRGQAGAIIAIAQGLTLTASVLSYTQVDGLVGADGRVSREDAPKARTWRLVNWISFGAAASVDLAGVLDAVVHFEEESVTTFPVARDPPRAPAAPGETAPEPPPTPAPSPAPPTSPAPDSAPVSASLFLAPMPGGAAAGIVGTF